MGRTPSQPAVLAYRLRATRMTVNKIFSGTVSSRFAQTRFRAILTAAEMVPVMPPRTRFANPMMPN